MPRVRDLLYRFRPAGAPGAASAAGVPVDRTAELAAELEPLFAQLADTERECAAIREQAHRDADAIREREAARAGNLVTSAGDRAEAERVGAAARVQKEAEAEAAIELAAAEGEAAELRRRARRRAPTYVARVVAAVDALIDEPGRRERV